MKILTHSWTASPLLSPLPGSPTSPLATQCAALCDICLDACIWFAYKLNSQVFRFISVRFISSRSVACVFCLFLGNIIYTLCQPDPSWHPNPTEPEPEPSWSRSRRCQCGASSKLSAAAMTHCAHYLHKVREYPLATPLATPLFGISLRRKVVYPVVRTREPKKGQSTREREG